MVREFNRIEDIEKYYNKERNTYIFKEDDKYIDLVIFNFELNVEANIDANDITAWDINAKNITALDIKAIDIIAGDIDAWNIKARGITAEDINAENIKACDIKAKDIDAKDINARDINADDISYYAVCFAYKNIKCKSIKGTRENSKHFVLDGAIEVNA